MKRSLAIGSIALLTSLSGCSPLVLLPKASPTTTSVSPTVVATPTTTTPTSATPTTVADPLHIPPMPSPLPIIADPGTIDPILGKFPATDARRYQFGWLAYASKGRTMATAAKDTDASGILAKLNDADVYYAGSVVCTDVATNSDVKSILTWVTQWVSNDEHAVADKNTFDEALFVAAVDELCPSFSPVIKDVNYLTPTPDMIRAYLGVDRQHLSDDAANKFANWVCTSITNGETKSRIVTAVATKYGYPDDVTERLVGRIQTIVC